MFFFLLESFSFYFLLLYFEYLSFFNFLNCFKWKPLTNFFSLSFASFYLFFNVWLIIKYNLHNFFYFIFCFLSHFYYYHYSFLILLVLFFRLFLKK